VKNLFAIFHSIISLSARSARTPQEMAQSLRGRLDDLIRAKDLIRPGIMGAVVRTALEPYDDACGCLFVMPSLATASRLRCQSQ
jgi:hypothetical protein